MERRKVAGWKVPAPTSSVERLHQHAALRGPVAVQLLDELLKSHEDLPSGKRA
jgi:hypothetical protein